MSLQFAPGGTAPVRIEHDGVAYLVPAWIVAADYDCGCDSFHGCRCARLVLQSPARLEAHAELMAWSALRAHAELDPDGAEFECAGCSDRLLRGDGERCGECLVSKGA